jgi:hypothetical protein
LKSENGEEEDLKLLIYLESDVLLEVIARFYRKK